MSDTLENKVAVALKHALPPLTAGASVIINTSVLNRMAYPGAAAYAATKAALRAIVRGRRAADRLREDNTFRSTLRELEPGSYQVAKAAA